MAKAQILVAASDPGRAGGLTADLGSLGYTVAGVVSSLEKAWQQAEETRPDLVILDLKLLGDGRPGKSIRKLRERFPQGLLYLVADEDRPSLKKAGITNSFECLGPGYEARELRTLIDMALFRRELESKSGPDAEAVRRRQAELDLQRVNRALRTLSAANQAMVRADTEMDLLKDICRAVVEEGGYRLAWIGYTEDGPEKAVRPVAQAGYEEGYLESLKITWADTERGRGPTGTAIRTGKPAMARNILTDPDFTPWRQEALKRGYASSLVLPLLMHRQVFGALNIYAGEAEAFDAAEVHHLSDLAADISFGVTALRGRKERREMAAALRRSHEELEARVQDRTQELEKSNIALQTEVSERLWSEKKLRESEERYRLLVDLSPDAIAVHSQGRYIFINPAGAELFGAADPRDMIGKTVSDLIHPDYRQLVSERICQADTEGARTELEEIKILRLDGRTVDVEAAGVGIIYQGQPAVQVMLRDITRRKETERGLEHMASFPRLNPNPVLEVDRSGAVVYHNAASIQALKKLGKKQGLEAFLPGDLEELQAAAREKEGESFYREVRLGSRVFGENISFAGPFDVLRIYASDITARKQAELERQELLEKVQRSEEELQAINEELQVQAEELEAQTEELRAANLELVAAHTALRESEFRYRSLFQYNHAVMLLIDPETGEIVDANPAACSFYGYSKEELTARKITDLNVAPQEGVFQEMRRVKTGRDGHFFFQHRLAQGEVRDVEVYSSALRVQGRELLYSIIHDNTARKEAEEALRQAHAELEERIQERTTELSRTVAQLQLEITGRQRVEEALGAERRRLFSVLERIPAYVALISPDCTIPYANREFIRRFGDPGDRLCHEFLYGRPQPCEGCKALEVLKTNTPAVWEWTGRNGKAFQIYDYPFTDVDGSPLVLEMGADITDHKRVEGEIKDLNEKLEERVRERTAQLEAANKELEAFSYSVSHDLRTPLRAIEGFARILMDDLGETLDGEGLRLLQVIRSNTLIMGQLIDDLLTLSRLGRQELRFLEIDLEAVVTLVFGELQAQERTRQLELILNPMPPALGDPILLKRVLANLLENAVKFTQPREQAIIEVGGWTEGKENIYFVKDNGVGFDMRFVDKIFGVFQRLHRREEFDGTGVGLAIVQRIIHRHGGRVWANGEVNGGAALYFALPRKEEKGEMHD